MSPPETTGPPPSQSNSLIRIKPEAPGQRLDLAVVEHVPDLSRSEVQRLIRAGHILVNGTVAKPAYRLESNDDVTVNRPSPVEVPVTAEDIPLTVLHEDDDLIAIDKPAGMVVHPATSHQSGTLVNAALFRWPNLRLVGGAERAGVVHRLDKDTSGVIVLAKTEAALTDLQSQFKHRTVDKRYLALVEGLPESSEGIIDAPLGRDPKRRKRIAVVRDGRESVTHYKLIQAFDNHALLEVHPRTGRTHQIRVHLAWLGHPVVGDRVYGYRKQRVKIKHLWLHAAALTVQSPTTQQPLKFESPLPSALQHILSNLQ